MAFKLKDRNMASKKYKSRKLHEQLYQRLVKENNTPPFRHERNIPQLSDYQLLKAIDWQLRAMDCIGLSYDELEVELH